MPGVLCEGKSVLADGEALVEERIERPGKAKGRSRTAHRPNLDDAADTARAKQRDHAAGRRGTRVARIPLSV